jgi:ABC-type branched-subunit amino acid transport system ATPase component/branched-subunit amino acid ABC-type transport system permease component
MSNVLQYAVLGLGTGAIYALLAQGVVAVYRGSSVLNFAHGAIAMIGAFLFFELHTQRLWGVAPAFATAVAAAAAIGLLVHQLVIRHLHRSTALSREIATLGALLVLEATAVKVWGSDPKFVTPWLPSGLFKVGGIYVGYDRLILLAVAVAITAGLFSLYKYSTFGLATVAAAENRRATAAFGWSPDMLASVNWTLGAALAGAAGVLIAPLTGVQPEAMTFLVIPALAAALIGGFESFPLTLVGAVAIGIAQSEIAGYVTQQGASASFPFLIIVVFLVLRGKGLPVRGYVGERFSELGTGVVRVRVLLPATALVALLSAFVFPVALLDSVTVLFAVSTVMLSVVVLTGYTGQLSLAQFALGGMGAFVAAKLVSAAGWPFVLALPVAVLVTIPAGLLVGVPALRTRGVNLAVVTLGLGVAIQATVFNNARLTGGSDGTPVGAQTLFGWSIDAVDHPARYALVVFGMFGLCAFAVTRLRRGRVGRRLIAVRTNERAAAALGISVFGAKLYAFGLSAGIAAVGGVMLGFRNHTILYDSFGPFQSIIALAYTVVGGLGNVGGPLFGAPAYPGSIGSWIFQTLFSSGIESYLPLIGGIAVLVFLLVDPNGLVSAHTRLFAFWARLFRRLLRRPARGIGSVERPTPTVSRVHAAHGQVEPQALTVTGLTVRYGGVTAVDDVSITVEPGQIVGLIGPNGAGKTTLIDAVTGFTPISTGDVRLSDARINGWSVHQRSRAGIARSFQSLELFEDISVRDNLRAASDPHDRGAYFTNLIAARNRTLPQAALAAIDEFGLTGDLDARPDELPYGRRRLVAVARAVATEPSILLLDEPAAGLDENEALELAELVRRLAKSWGIGILLVEHQMAFVLGVCDRITVLDFGKQIAEGTVLEVRRDPAVIAAYLGAPELTTERSRGDSENVAAGGV